jgi:cytochrome c biogenesis protein CcmG/thiol:disulfide interchange protein DsbE
MIRLSVALVRTVGSLVVALSIFAISPVLGATPLQSSNASSASTNQLTDKTIWPDHWRETVDVPKDHTNEWGLFEPARITLSVEQGWLVGRRETVTGDLEWQVVLGQASQGEPPQIKVDKAGGCEISYGSELFIHDAGNSLRVQRERKTANSPPWPKVNIDLGEPSGSFQNHGQRLSGGRVKQWQYVSCATEDGRQDLCARIEIGGLCIGAGQYTTTKHTIGARFGDRRVVDDGEFFLAERALSREAERSLLVKKIREESAPELSIKQWFNAPQDETLAKLRGKVILLDFWGTWCGACVQRLPESEALWQKYKDRGLVVIGVHSAEGDDAVGTFLQDKKYSFPIAVDKGDTAARYAIDSWPTYFLIDKAGKVQLGFESTPPTETQIENLLTLRK